VGHRLVRAGNEQIDLVRLGTEQRIVSREGEGVGYSPAPLVRRILEGESKALDGAEAPRNSRREQGIDECICVR